MAEAEALPGLAILLVREFDDPSVFARVALQQDPGADSVHLR